MSARKNLYHPGQLSIVCNCRFWVHQEMLLLFECFWGKLAKVFRCRAKWCLLKYHWHITFLTLPSSKRAVGKAFIKKSLQSVTSVFVTPENLQKSVICAVTLQGNLLHNPQLYLYVKVNVCAWPWILQRISLQSKSIGLVRWVEQGNLPRA